MIFETDEIKNGEHKYLCHCDEFKVRKTLTVCYVFRFEKVLPAVPTIKTTNYSSCYYSTKTVKQDGSVSMNSTTTKPKKPHFKNLFEFAYDHGSGKILGGYDFDFSFRFRNLPTLLAR